MKNTEFITAYKGAITQQFTRKSWDVLGSDKYGWVLVPEVPKEVKGFAGEVNNMVEIDNQLPLMPAVAEIEAEITDKIPDVVQKPTTRKSKKRR